MKKSILLAAVAFSSTVGFAQAADMAVKAPPVYASPALDEWSGLYGVGLIGYGWNTGNVSAPIFQGVDLSTAPQGFVGGGAIGLGQLFPNRLYLGIEGDVVAAALDGSANQVGLLFENKNRWMATLRARLGWVPTTDTMLYLTAGWGWSSGDFAVRDATTQDIVVSTKATLSGAVVGGGLEYAFTRNWHGRVEYLRYFLDDINLKDRTNVFAASQNVGTVRAGVVYKF